MSVKHTSTRSWLLPAPVRRFREHLREIRRVASETNQRVIDSHAELIVALGRVDSAVRTQSAAEQAHLLEALRVINGRTPWLRRRLRELRADPAYGRPYTEPDPLISVVIPTYDNHVLLRERSIQSVLAQTYQNFEIVVVGDAAPAAVREAVESFDDARISYWNLPYRGPYPEDPTARWLVAGGPPYNEAVQRARGLWIAPLDDDDAFRPNHLELLLAHAQSEHLELAYSQLAAHVVGGGPTRAIGQFPPRLGQFGYQSALYHHGLSSIFELELADAAFGLPNDWGLCQRMMEAGVRIGMLEEETVDNYPARVWTPRWTWKDETSTADAEPDSPESSAEWEYIGEQWDSSAARGWDAEEVAGSLHDKWPGFLEAVQGPGPLGVHHEVPRGSAIDRHNPTAQGGVLAWAYALARAGEGVNSLSVLDWGGALGHAYVFARELFPDLKLEYHCRELPAVCAVGREVLPDVTFHVDDSCLDRQYDLVAASNSLQYEQDWRARLGALAEATTHWLFLNRVPLATRHPGFVVLQRAHRYGYATEYVGWVLGGHELLEAARSCGLELIREFVFRPPFAIDGAPDDVSDGGFLFRRAVRK